MKYVFFYMGNHMDIVYSISLIVIINKIYQILDPWESYWFSFGLV